MTLIGMPICLDDRGRWRSGRDYHYVDSAYARAIAEAGATLIYLPLGGAAEDLLDAVDGLLLPGGDDLPPPTPYPASVHFDLVPEAQLEFDRALLDSALSRGLPCLGICYGMQLLALAHGGRLIYDLATDRPTAAQHRLAEADGRHAVQIDAGTRLAQILESEHCDVNSLHHQAVDSPGAGLRVCARSDDGVVEAIETTQTGFSLGVQWHPEKLASQTSRRIFAAFVSAARSRAPQRPAQIG